MDKFNIDIEIVEINEVPLSQSLEELNESEESTPTGNETLPGFHLFVKAYLGETEIELVVDTGASKSVFDPSLLSEHIEMSKNDEAIQSMSVNAELEIGFGYINSFKIGEIEIKEMPVGFTSLEAVNQMYESIIGKRIWGLLGSDFLMAYKAVIDYGSKKITLNKQPS